MTPSLENVKCYGQPEDCRGWRQFLVQRACPAVDPTGGPALPSLGLLPSAIWVAEPTSQRNVSCSHSPFYIVHPSSVAALNLPPSIQWIICAPQGRFIE